MAKQAELPTLEREKCKDVEDAADTYRTLRDRRMRTQEKEEEAHDALLTAMHDNKLKKYRLDEESYVDIDQKERARVRRIRAKGEE